MKVFNIVLIIIVALLSIAAGAAKVMAVPGEVQFLQSFGFSNPLITTYGILQLSGGGLLIPPKTRMLGAFVASASFLISTILIFISGNTIFGLISIIPVALTLIVAFQLSKFTHNKRLNSDNR
ncbi:hypothetical protein [Pseudoalteromonas sp.]|uniref:hypothetical protein n=1 Tax=Pseudoalteromonas sp. TaxID=53249 RepID=UPI003567FB38